MGSESGGDYDPGPWKGWSYEEARKAYDTTAGRGYSYNKEKSKNDNMGKDESYRKPTKPKNDDLRSTPHKKNVYDTIINNSRNSEKTKEIVPEKIKTESISPVVIATDVTGSMKHWPQIIFEKLPLLDLGLKDYLEKPEICFMAVGDAYQDDYPLQVQNFGSGTDLVQKIASLIPEGGGGGTKEESYDLAAIYSIYNIEMPNAVKPIFIFIGDEGFYPYVDEDHAKRLAHVTLEKRITSKQTIDDLKKKFSVYCIRKLYNSTKNDEMSDTDKKIHEQWINYLGEEKVKILNEPRRVGDVILGLVAQETGNQEHFLQELTQRQTGEQVKTVTDTLYNKKYVSKEKNPTKSLTKGSKTIKKSEEFL